MKWVSNLQIWRSFSSESLLFALPSSFNSPNIYQIVMHFHWIQTLEIFSMTTRMLDAASAICFKFSNYRFFFLIKYNHIRFNCESVLQWRNPMDSLKHFSEDTVKKLLERERKPLILLIKMDFFGGAGRGLLLREIREVPGRNLFSSKLETICVPICAS